MVIGMDVQNLFIWQSKQVYSMGPKKTLFLILPYENILRQHLLIVQIILFVDVTILMDLHYTMHT